MVRMVTVQTQFIFQNCIEPEGTFSQTGSHMVTAITKKNACTHLSYLSGLTSSTKEPQRHSLLSEVALVL